MVLRRREPLRVGFLPVSDCAPLVYASEAGLFVKYDLDVELRRETSWTNLRDKVIYGELDAAHAPATLPFLANLGLESDPCACVSGLVLSLQGNAITISRQLWEQGVRDAQTLREQIYKSWGKRTYTFGVVFSFSSQELLLRHWLRSAGIIPEAEIRIVAIPPEQMFPTLKLGYIDGYCVGEPWTSVAVQAGVGICVATSAELAPLHPEKVLMVRQSFATGSADEHERLMAALLEACAVCDEPASRPLLSEMLADRQYVNAPAECLRSGLVGPFACGDNRFRSLLDLTIFHGHNANDPSDDKARWIMDHLYGLLKDGFFVRQNQGRTPVLTNIFRRDLFERAQALMLQETGAGQSEADTGNPIALVGADVRRF
jgi:ABC-type nitrate/sulfonate/bicarbonate transport system substrate-binding protein